MTTATMNSHRALNDSAARSHRIEGHADLLQRVRAWLKVQRRYRATYDELSSLDDRMLNDIGITRADIEAVAQRCAR